MQRELGYKNMCQCLIKLLFIDSNHEFLSHDSLINIRNRIKQMNTTNTNITSPQKQQSQLAIEKNGQKSQQHEILFSLMKLPFDLIPSVLYGLNEQDIKSIDLAVVSYIK